MTTLARSTEVITGRGVAEPPKLNIRTFQRPDEEYYHHRGHSQAITSYQPNNQRDIYDTLRERLHSNEQIQKYIVSLKNQLRREQTRDRQRLQIGDYNRASSVGYSNGLSGTR